MGLAVAREFALVDIHNGDSAKLRLACQLLGIRP